MVIYHSTSSINDRIKRMPRPVTFKRLSGSVGSGICIGSKPSPKSRTVISKPSAVSAKLDLDVFFVVKFVPVLYGVCDRFADGQVDRGDEIVA